MLEEFRRRLLPIDYKHTVKKRKVVIKNFLQKMADSRYQHSKRKEIIKSAVVKYYREETGGKKMFKPKEEMMRWR